MPIDYDAIKSSLTPEQQKFLEGAKKKRRKPRAIALVSPPIDATSVPSMGWMNCENGCIGRTHGPDQCEICDGKMLPGPSSGAPHRTPPTSDPEPPSGCTES